MLMTLGLDKMMTLAELSILDFDMKEEILKDNDFEHAELLLDSWAGSASKRIRVVPPAWIVRLRIWAT